jgi:hypothetical protein
MNYKEAKILAKEWFDNLKLPDNLEGKQVNLLSYITDPIDTPLFRQKRTLLGIELKKRGAKSIGEPDNWNFEETEFLCDYYIKELKDILSNNVVKTLAKAKSELMPILNKSSKSIRYKLQHISSILVNSDLPYIEEFKPIPRAEIDLIDFNETYNLKKILTEKFNDKSFISFLDSIANNQNFISEFDKQVEIEKQPQQDIFEEDNLPQQKSIKIRPKINYVEREIRNSKLGEEGEKWVLEFEEQKLKNLGLTDLANEIVWASKNVGDGLGYDIISFNSQREKIYIEVKTTCLGKFSAFYLTKKELEVSVEINNYKIYRVFDFDKETKIYIVEDNLINQLDLTPTTYRATMKKTNA